jgi:hypothetical protein
MLHSDRSIRVHLAKKRLASCCCSKLLARVFSGLQPLPQARSNPARLWRAGNSTGELREEQPRRLWQRADRYAGRNRHTYGDGEPPTAG